MPGLDEKIALFNRTYGASLSIDILDNTLGKKLAYINNFLLDPKPEVSPKKQYLNTLTNVILYCIDKKLKINPDGAYRVSDLNIPAMIRDYEDIMKERKQETEYSRQREPYEGIKYETVVKYVMKNTEKYDKMLSMVWMDNILNKTLSIQDMKAVTDDAIKILGGLKKETFTEAHKPLLHNLVSAMHALEGVRQQRGRLWKIFNFRINRREKAYLTELANAYNHAVWNDLPLTEAQDEIFASVMDQAKADVKLHLQHEKQRAAGELLQNSFDKKKFVSVSNEGEQLDERLKDEQLKAKLTTELLAKLPKCRWTKEEQQPVFQIGVIPMLHQEAQNCNKNFIEGMGVNAGAHKLLADNAKAIFLKAYATAGWIGYVDMKDKLVAAQVMTDEIMKNYSLAALDNSYAEFANGYILNHVEEIAESIGLEPKDPILEEAKTTFDNLERNVVEIVELTPQEHGETVPPVQNQEPSTNLHTNKNLNK